MYRLEHNHSPGVYGFLSSQVTSLYTTEWSLHFFHALHYQIGIFFRVEGKTTFWFRFKITRLVSINGGVVESEPRSLGIMMTAVTVLVLNHCRL